MTFLRVKPVRKLNKITGKTALHHYVYEVKSYKDRGKVRQKTIQFLGKYIQLDKKKEENFPIKRALEVDSKEQLLKEIFAFNLENYGFKKCEPEIYKNQNVIADLKTCKVFDSSAGKDIYLNINGKFFGTQTIRKAIKSNNSDLFSFVKTLIDAGIVGIEFSEFKQLQEKGSDLHEFKLLRAIIKKFGPSAEEIKEMSYEDFVNKVGY